MMYRGESANEFYHILSPEDMGALSIDCGEDTLMCEGCKESTTLSQLVRGYCPDCQVSCSICDDWIAGRDEMRDEKDRRCHVDCYAAEVLEMLPSMSMRCWLLESRKANK